KLRYLHLKAGDQPYLDRLIEVKDTEGLAPVTVDIRLYRAVIVEGRLVDAATGGPVRGAAFYQPLAANALLKMPRDAGLYRGEVGVRIPGTYADPEADGRFRLRVPLGPGVVMARADTSIDPTARYAPARVADADRQYLYKPQPGAIRVGPAEPPGE